MARGGAGRSGIGYVEITVMAIVGGLALLWVIAFLSGTTIDAVVDSLIRNVKGLF